MTKTTFRTLQVRLTELLARSADQEALDAEERTAAIDAQQIAPRHRKFNAQVVAVTQSVSDFDGVGQSKH